MKKNRIRTIVFGVGIAFFVPLICYFILKSKGHTGHIKLPSFYGIDSVIDKKQDDIIQKDTIYHIMKDTRFISHLNDSINISSDYDGKMLLISFFYTNDTADDARLSYHMKKIQAGFKEKKNEGKMQLLSITVDPTRDSVNAIRIYANKLTGDHDTWTFLTGEARSIHNFIRKELFVPYPETTAAIYLPHEFVLVDKYRNIRGLYNGLDTAQIKNCLDDMAKLMIERNPIHEPSKR